MWAVFGYCLRRYHRTWQSAITTTVLLPIVMMLALSFGLGRVVADSHALGSARYIDFVVPGLVAAIGMQIASVEATVPVFMGVNVLQTFSAIVATPVDTDRLADGYLVWTAVRSAIGAGVVVLTGAALGGPATPALAALVLLGAVCGLAHAAPLFALSAQQTNMYALQAVSRIALLPMFLGAGTLYPVSVLPAPVSWLARATPVWNTADLGRHVLAGSVASIAVAVEAVYVALWIAAGWLAARASLGRRMYR